MPRKPSRKSTHVAGDGQPVLLSGGNPQIAKADGDASVQAHIAAMPGWKSDIGRRLDDLIVRTVLNVRKAVRWNLPWYGIKDETVAVELVGGFGDARLQQRREPCRPGWRCVGRFEIILRWGKDYREEASWELRTSPSRWTRRRRELLPRPLPASNRSCNFFSASGFRN